MRRKARGFHALFRRTESPQITSTTQEFPVIVFLGGDIPHCAPVSVLRVYAQWGLEKPHVVPETIGARHMQSKSLGSWTISQAHQLSLLRSLKFWTMTQTLGGYSSLCVQEAPRCQGWKPGLLDAKHVLSPSVQSSTPQQPHGLCRNCCWSGSNPRLPSRPPVLSGWGRQVTWAPYTRCMAWSSWLV